MAAADKFDKNGETHQSVFLQQDVLNETMRLEVVEQELINSNTSDSFKISFSTHQPSANIEILVDD